MQDNWMRPDSFASNPGDGAGHKAKPSGGFGRLVEIRALKSFRGLPAKKCPQINGDSPEVVLYFAGAGLMRLAAPPRRPGSRAPRLCQ